jgi:hypothetical protein
MRYALRLMECLSSSSKDEWESEKARLFEMFTHNPGREPPRRRNFLFFSPGTH